MTVAVRVLAQVLVAKPNTGRVIFREGGVKATLSA